MRHFSGTATYRKEVVIPAGLLEGAPHLVLDLGEVRNIARVRWNGADLGIIWMRPARIDVSRAVRTGTNALEIDVTNLWPNRLIGDAALPEAERITRTNIRTFAEDAPLLPSGLLGPVRIRAVRAIDLAF
ncbi:MAG: hypothetical protein JXP34_21245 [Planctomycetes bacterium]|nr:hypothetical protein [Planctomycetota bacterium]